MSDSGDNGGAAESRAEAPAFAGPRPPILLLIVDCLRADRAFAQARLSPNGFLGRLVRRGHTFTSAVTVTPTTTPAVATMLTGLYPFEHGVRDHSGYRVKPGTATLAGTTMTWQADDPGTPWLALAVDLTDPGAVNPPQTLDLGQLATSGSTTLAVPPGTWQASLRATNSAAQTTTVQLGTIVQPG